MNTTMRMGLLAASVFLVGGCAGLFNKEPIVDLKGVDQQAYAADLAECRAYADGVQVERGVLAGAATGAVVGGVVGAVAGNSDSAKRTAGIGGIFGGVSGAGSATAERRQVLRNCLVGRGYRVLN